jgi:periplasmic divalent cation tolerance protein
MEDFIQVITTVEDEAEAKKIARTLVEKRLAACVQIAGPVSSVYWWEDSVVEEQEHICLIKSSQKLYPLIEEAIREIHSYDIPEIISVPLADGSAGYLAWMIGELRE